MPVSASLVCERVDFRTHLLWEFGGFEEAWTQWVQSMERDIDRDSDTPRRLSHDLASSPEFEFLTSLSPSRQGCAMAHGLSVCLRWDRSLRPGASVSQAVFCFGYANDEFSCWSGLLACVVSARERHVSIFAETE